MASRSQDSGGYPQPDPKRQKTSDDERMLSYVNRQRDGWLSRCYSKDETQDYHNYRRRDDTLVYGTDGTAISSDTMLDEQSQVLQNDYIQVEDKSVQDDGPSDAYEALGILDPTGCELSVAIGGAATGNVRTYPVGESPGERGGGDESESSIADDEDDDESFAPTPPRMPVHRRKNPTSRSSGSSGSNLTVADLRLGPQTLDQLAEWPRSITETLFLVADRCSGKLKRSDSSANRLSRVISLMENGLVLHSDFAGYRGVEHALAVMEE